MTGRLQDRVCVVTGGASGIGAAVARRFIDQGARVVITDIQDDKGAAFAAEAGCEFQHQDVSDEAAWTTMLDDVKSRHSRLDVLVNNAGIFRPGSIEEMTVDTLRQVLDINVVGVAVGCREAVRLMKENPGGAAGAIVNVSSITGFVGLASAAAYTASKGAVRLLTKSVAVHCARHYRNIRCNSLHPGVIDTPMNQSAFDASDDPAGMKTTFSAMQPIGRMISAAEIANGVLYLASDDSSAMTGAELLIDGGWLAAPNPL